jgi:phosphohistidine phosphatase
MKIYIVRHAIAGEADPTRWPDDSQRPLTNSGRKRFRQAARGLQRIVSDVDLVYSSPFVRAQQTAAILHEEAGWPEPELHAELGSHPPDDARALIERAPDVSSLAVVGHEPQLSRLTALLVTSGGAARIELRKGAVVCLDLPRPGPATDATLEWLLQPKLLRRLAKR